ncbi:MAG TPA: DsbC family protein [Plasticicumulans sp.]|uniref:DsbC family protein n=1 Tax=Plasticicumulans sp. TaxID=2307179 RepID=UPI000F9FCA24|nr:DsbC family protein [Plasticicumulans sp.]MBS0603081.1 DsbC family protein [Pseudomonadota bacterium]RTL00082.1 MAG: DsbC family protein [Xanthomonadales bacterium]HMV38478.1 DsbC family protein [Plasticicumulans sp.]HMW30562.1 DsbC family protein [Plasticicumulans sp.]HMW42140.1 DsbC family protein [Plasticicumulans sp.]
MLKPLFAALAIALGTATAAAGEAAPAAGPDLTRLSAVLDGRKPDAVNPTPVPGLYEVILGARVLYVSADGRYVLRGDLVDIDKGENLTEARSGQLRVRAIAAVPESDMIVFAPPGPVQAKHTVTVFTDIDCGYCRKLHSEIDNYLRAGIRVRYLAYPRSGLRGESYDKAVSVWCAEDPKAAITSAKKGQAVAKASCPDNPVAKEYELGNQVGVQGTPTIVLENGDLVPGYVPAARLVMMLDHPELR